MTKPKYERVLAAALAVSATAALGPEPAAAQEGRVRATALARIELARRMAADAELLRALAARNVALESLDEVRRKDRAWSDDPDATLRRELSGNACAARLRSLTQQDPVVVEAILMDAQGANVCVSRETSDYWQGDEPKFQKTYDADKDIFVDEPAFDASSGAWAIQLSVLVREAGAKQGALTLTLRIRREDVEGQGGRGR